MSRINSALVRALVAIIIVAGSSACSKKPKHPNVMLIVLDTLRADHLGGFGYERDTSPVLDRFAKDNLRCAWTISAAPWTPASVATMFTGLYPLSHGMMPPNGRAEARKNLTKLVDPLETLAERFKAEGYATAGVTPNPWTSVEFGYSQGFDVFRYDERAAATKINAHAFEILDKDLSGEKPFFMYLHYLDPHDPYDPPGEFKEMFQGALAKPGFDYPPRAAGFINKYDGEIRYLDTELGKLFDRLKEKKLYDDLVILIVADHGEQFMERGNQGHGFQLFNEELHVPLFLKSNRPELAGKNYEFTTSTVDIMPTLLELGGIPVPNGFPGVSLLRESDHRSRPGVMSEIRRINEQRSFTAASGDKLILSVAIDHGVKSFGDELSAWKSPSVTGVFNRNTDPTERTPGTDAALQTDLTAKFRNTFEEALKRRVTPSDSGTDVSDETLDQLETLGYLK